MRNFESGKVFLDMLQCSLWAKRNPSKTGRFLVQGIGEMQESAPMVDFFCSLGTSFRSELWTRSGDAPASGFGCSSIQLASGACCLGIKVTQLFAMTARNEQIQLRECLPFARLDSQDDGKLKKDDDEERSATAFRIDGELYRLGRRGKRMRCA